MLCAYKKRLVLSGYLVKRYEIAAEEGGEGYGKTYQSNVDDYHGKLCWRFYRAWFVCMLGLSGASRFVRYAIGAVVCKYWALWCGDVSWVGRRLGGQDYPTEMAIGSGKC